MSSTQGSFEKALGAFRAHAAQQFGVDAAGVQVIPATEAAANDWKGLRGPGGAPLSGKIGRAWAFSASAPSASAEVHGWALPDGTVMTLHHNLGRLFEEAGVFGEHHAEVNPFELSYRLMWGSGTNNNDLRGAPKLTVNKDGTGMLQFTGAYKPPPAGMAPIEIRYDWRFKFAAGHKVEFEQVEVK